MKFIEANNLEEFKNITSKLHKACLKNKNYTSKQYCGTDLISINNKILIPYLVKFSKEIDSLNLNWIEKDSKFIKANEL